MFVSSEEPRISKSVCIYIYKTKTHSLIDNEISGTTTDLN